MKIINYITSLFSNKPSTRVHPDPDYSSDISDVPRWPPFDNGLPKIDIDKILATQSTLIDNINKSLNSPIADEAILKYLHFVHLLPATKDTNHRGAGGLFRFGLEIAYNSLRAAEGKIFSASETPDVRRLTEPKWRLAAFLAGLCSESYRAMSGMVVTSIDGNKWPSLNTPLYQWLDENGYDRYFIRWVNGNNHNSLQAQSMSAFVTNSIIPDSAKTAISTEFNEIALALMATISGSGLDHPNPLTALVHDVTIRVIEKDINNDKGFGQAIVGMHLEPYIISAMRRMVTNGTWTVNQKGSRLWMDDAGLYLIWKPAYDELYKSLDNDVLRGMPKDMDVLADMLVKSGAFAKNEKNNANYWIIYPPTAQNSYSAVLLETPDILLDIDSQRSITQLDNLLKQHKPQEPSSTDIPLANNANQQEHKTPTNTEVKVDQKQDKKSNKPEKSKSDLNQNNEVKPKHELPIQEDLLPSARSFEINPRTKIHLQKLSVKSVKFLEDLIIATNSPQPDKAKLGFICSDYEDSYAIPLSLLDEHHIDRVTFVEEMHAQNFHYTRPGETRRVHQLENPYGNKVVACVLINNHTSKLFELIKQ